MKRTMAYILSAVLLLSLGVFALADGTTTLTTTVPAANYTLTIPQDLTVPYGAESVEVKDLDAEAVSGFAVGKNLKVTVSYTPFACAGISTVIPYSVEGYLKTEIDTASYGNINSGDGILFKCVDTNILCPANAAGDVLNMSGAPFMSYYFALRFNAADWGRALSGDYTSTMTFTSEVVVAG